MEWYGCLIVYNYGVYIYICFMLVYDYGIICIYECFM